jgi:hypothetical protein
MDSRLFRSTHRDPSVEPLASRWCKNISELIARQIRDAIWPESDKVKSYTIISQKG